MCAWLFFCSQTWSFAYISYSRIFRSFWICSTFFLLMLPLARLWILTTLNWILRSASCCCCSYSAAIFWICSRKCRSVTQPESLWLHGQQCLLYFLVNKFHVIKSLYPHLREMVDAKLQKAFAIYKISFKHPGIELAIVTRSWGTNKIWYLLKRTLLSEN